MAAVFKTPRGPRGRWLANTVSSWRSSSADAREGADSEWSCFERRRHLMQPPGLFDEAEKKFEKFGELSEANVPASSSSSSCSGESAPRKPRPVDGVRRRPASSTPNTVQPEELGLRKARFFDTCLRADRALAMPRLPSPGPPQSAREKDPSSRQRSGGESHYESEGGADTILPTLAQSVGGLVNSCKRAKIPPATTGIIRSAGKKLQLQYGCVTDQRAEAIASSLRASASDVNEAHFQSNGLSERGAKYLLSALPDTVRFVDISQNELGHNLASGEPEEGHGSWCFEFTRMTQLRSLNASFSSLGDAVCKELCKALASCRALVELNLSGNNIYKEGPRALGYLVRGHRAIENLDLHFNQITGESARDFVRGLHEHAHMGGCLRSLNLSWNPLGKAGGEETCKAMAQLFTDSSELKHVDLAKCDLSFSHCQILSDGLQSNTSILGIHIQGNAGRVDFRGALRPMQSPLKAPLGKPPLDPAAEQSQLDSMVQINRSTSVEEEGTCCWVCDCWRETSIQYVPGISGPEAAEVWVFTSLDMFEEPLRMKKVGSRFVLFLMAPAGALRYVFQVGTELITSRTAPLQRNMRPVRIRRQRLAGENAAGGEEEVEGDPLAVDVTSLNSEMVRAREANEPVCQVVVPRRGCEQQGEVPEAEWTIKSSLFANYEEALVRRPFCESCFDNDWRQADLATLLRNFADYTDRSQVKDLLRTHYAEIKMLYASLCSVNWELARKQPQEREEPLCFGVSLYEFTHVLVQHNLVSDDLTLEDADSMFIVCALPSQEAFEAWHSAIQKNGHVLLRHSFLEFLVRVALRNTASDKWGRTVGDNLVDLLNKHITYPHPSMKNIFRCMQWRTDVLHTEVVEAVFRKHMRGTVAPLFEAYSSGGSEQERFLSPEDWFALLDALQVLSPQDNEGQMQVWDRVCLWQMSAMSHIDELKSTHHLELLFVEFLEALARLVALLRSRQRAATATPEEAERWDYGLGMPSAPAIFCCDKEGVMETNAFANHLDAFLCSDALKKALALRQSA